MSNLSYAANLSKDNNTTHICRAVNYATEKFLAIFIMKTNNTWRSRSGKASAS